MRIRRCLGVTFLFFGLACGGGGSASGYTVSVPGDESAPFNSLSADELTDLCEDVNASRKAIMLGNSAALCLMKGVGEAIGNRPGSNVDRAEAAALCKKSQSECVDTISSRIDNKLDVCGEKTEEWAACTATSGEMEACINLDFAEVQHLISVLNVETCDTLATEEGLDKIQALFFDVCDDLPSECDI
jgi:hypothetical protein